MEQVDQTMRTAWDWRAQNLVTAMNFIIDGYRGSPEAFYASGRKHVEDCAGALCTFAELEPQQLAALSAVEVGCGVGRMTGWFSLVFKQVFATDVSVRMVQLAREFPNVKYFATPSLLTLPERADVVLSHIVFQHVPKRVFWRYLAEAARVVKPGGYFHTQLHRTEQPVDHAESETLLVRGYTPAELEAGIDPDKWDILSNLQPFGLSETWYWLTLRRK